MEVPDARSLPEETLELLRKQAHQLRRKGHTWNEIASIVGVHRWTLMSWAKRFGIGTDEGPSDVSSGRRGRRFGEGRTLSPTDEVTLYEQIIAAAPTALGLPCALWTRRAVQQAIEVTFAQHMPLRTVGEYLRRWGFTPQRRAKGSIGQQPEEVQQWLRLAYPGIVEKARTEGADIQWADETAVRLDTTPTHGWGSATRTPIQSARSGDCTISMLSTLDNRGLVRFAAYNGGVNTERFIDFLQAIVSDSAGRKVHLIVEGLRVHHALRVQAWLDVKAHLIELHYLPTYSPDANLGELSSGDSKTESRSALGAGDAPTLKAMARVLMHKVAWAKGRYNRGRLHGCIDYRTPAGFEQGLLAA